ncbi:MULTISPECIES: hypothetical protein [Aquimarina]|nr:MULTISPECIES: hypothetical protein [Aquimarina]
MKNITKYLSLTLLSILTLGCSGDDKIVDRILDDVTSGAVLRTRDTDNNMVYNNLTGEFTATSNYILTLEEQDASNGDLLDNIEIFARFVENTKDDANSDGTIDDDNLTTTEGLIRTLTIADFTTGPRNLPESVVTFTADELVAFTGVDESKIQGSDDFALRFKINLTDGRSFSEDDVNGNVSGGSYFSSPFAYRSSISCDITESLADTYTYTVTSLQSAPGGRSQCQTDPGDLPSGTVTWSETDTPGEYSTSDISFGQFDNCYVDTFSKIEFDEILITWDCTNLKAGGTIETVENDTNKEIDFTYVYTIKETSGSDMTIDFSNSEGDRGTVVLTRPAGKVWPILLRRME